MNNVQYPTAQYNWTPEAPYSFKIGDFVTDYYTLENAKTMLSILRKEGKQFEMFKTTDGRIAEEIKSL